MHLLAHYYKNKPATQYNMITECILNRFQVDASVGTEIGTMTEPDCLGPLDPGTSVTLEGIVWNETDGGKRSLKTKAKNNFQIYLMQLEKIPPPCTCGCQDHHVGT